MSARLHALADDWKALAIALKADSLSEWGITAAQLEARAEIYAECAQQLRRRLGIEPGRVLQPDERGRWHYQDEETQ